MAVLQLLEQYTEVRREPSESASMGTRRPSRMALPTIIFPKWTAIIRGSTLWDNMYNGIVKGIFAFGMNGVTIGPDSKKNIDALKKADWLVVGEIYQDETSEFWKAPGITQDEMKTDPDHGLSFAMRGFRGERWIVHKFRPVAAVEERGAAAPGDCRLDQAIVAQIFLRVRALYPEGRRKIPGPDFESDVELYRSDESIACGSVEGNQRQSAGRSGRSGDQTSRSRRVSKLPGFAWLKDDGTTTCGNWIYSGAYHRGRQS